MTNYVIHKHMQTGQVHWDLMIEQAGNLATWRLDVPPQEFCTGPVRAEKIFDHDKKFLTYEGPVKNGTGMVEIVDKGTCKIETVNENEMKIKFAGKILKGKFKFQAQKKTDNRK